MAKLNDKELAYYKSKAKGVEFTDADAKQVDDDRLTRIGNMGEQDVINKRPAKERSAFKNDAEFKYYNLALYETATNIQYGLI